MLRMACLLLIACLVSAVPALGAQRVAFIVGNSDYVRLTKLRNALNDAKALKEVLEERLGFHVVYASDAGDDAMKAKIEEFADAATDADVALFYYAGHAVELNDTNFLMPVDFDDRSRASYVNQTTRLDNLLLMTQLVRAKTKILVVDACRANPFEDQRTRGGVSLRLSKLPAMSTNTLVVFSTQPGKLAEDGAGRHSPFAEALLAHVETPGIDVVSMFQSVAVAVAKSTDGRQTPWLDQNFLKGQSVYLGSPSGLACDPADAAADRKMCKALLGGASGMSLQSYLDCYPEGFCAAGVRELAKMQDALDDEEKGEVVVASGDPAPGLTRGMLNPYQPRSYWSHNDSVVSLADNGNTRIFFYEKPRSGMLDAGVRKGTMLFKGQFSHGRMSYSGEAYLFSKKCGPVAYKVEGKVSPDYRTVELRGDRPVRDASCRRTGTRPEKLLFKFVSTRPPG